MKRFREIYFHLWRELFNSIFNHVYYKTIWLNSLKQIENVISKQIFSFFCTRQDATVKNKSFLSFTQGKKPPSIHWNKQSFLVHATLFQILLILCLLLFKSYENFVFLFSTLRLLLSILLLVIEILESSDFYVVKNLSLDIMSCKFDNIIP